MSVIINNHTGNPPKPAAGPMKIAYMMSRFPKHTETFILNEMIAVEELGAAIEVYPLLREQEAVIQPQAVDLVERAHYQPFLSFAIAGANARAFIRHPLLYCKTWFEVLKGTAGSMNFFIGALGVFPKAVYFAKTMTAENVTHIHAHFSNHPAVAALIIHRLTGIPFSFTAHGHDIHITRTMLREKVDAAAFAATVSSYNKALMAADCSAGAEDKIHILHCGVDTRVFQVKPGSADGGPVALICVASLLEVKGHTYLIQTCRLLREQGVSFICHLVGEGAYRQRLEQEIAEYSLQEQIILHGAQTQVRVRELLTQSDIFVLASVPTRRGAREGIPVAMMEAMAIGLPVVASDLSGIPELVRDGISGILTPPREVEALAKAIATLIGDRDLRIKMGLAGRETILRDFDQQTTAGKLIELIAAHQPS